MSAQPVAPDLPIAETLERDRLRRRERRLTLVVAELRARAATGRDESGTVPLSLGHAIADFDAQLQRVRTKLRRRTRLP